MKQYEFIILAVIHISYILITLTLYFRFYGPKDSKLPLFQRYILTALYDPSSELYKRSSIMLIFIGIFPVPYLLAGLHTGVEDGLDQCWTLSILMNFFMTAYIAAQALRVNKVIMQININRARRNVFSLGLDKEEVTIATAPLDLEPSSVIGKVGPAAATAQSTHTLSRTYADTSTNALSLFKAYHYWTNEVTMLKIAVVCACVVCILNVIPKVDPSYGCLPNLTPFWSIFVIGAVFISAGFPLAYWHLRGTRDVYHLASALRVSIISGPIAFVFSAVFLFTFKSDQSFGYLLFVLLMLDWVIPYSLSTVGCMLVDLYSHKATTTANETSFADLLKNDIAYQELRDVAVKEFTTENVLFWDAYIGMLRSFLKLLLKLPNSASETDEIVSKLTGGAVKDITALKNALLPHNGSILVDLVIQRKIKKLTDVTVDIAVSQELALKIVRMHEAFFTQSGKFELNIPEALNTSIEQRVSAIRAKLEKQAKNPQDDLDGAYVSFGVAKSGETATCVPFDLFDKTTYCVLEMIYLSTFPRYLQSKSRAANKV